jgi:hypothetical protein
MRPRFTIVTTTSPDGERAYHAVREYVRVRVVRQQLDGGRPIGDVLDSIACDFDRSRSVELYVKGEDGEVIDRIAFDVSHPNLAGPDEAAARRWAAAPAQEAA